MPLLAAFLFNVFSGIFETLAKRLTINLAICAAYVVTITAAYLAIKAVLAGIGIIAEHSLPSGLVTAFSILIPPSTPSVMTTVWIADATFSGWAWFQQRVPILYQLGKS